MSLEAEKIFDVLGDAGFKRKPVSSLLDLLKATRSGLPAKVIPSLSKRLGMPKEQVYQLVGIPERTLARKIAEHDVLTSMQSDRVLRLVRVFTFAKDVLGGDEKAARWLRTPNQALERQMPVDLMDTDLGVQEVVSVLGRIAYGVYS